MRPEESTPRGSRRKEDSCGGVRGSGIGRPRESSRGFLLPRTCWECRVCRGSNTKKGGHHAILKTAHISATLYIILDFYYVDNTSRDANRSTLLATKAWRAM